MNIGALILAPGASRRLGIPKQTVIVGGETLLDRAIRTADEAGCSPIVVVLGAHEELIRSQCSLMGAQLIFNPRWSEGMGTSLAQGVSEFQGADGIIVMTCDMPVVSASHLRELISLGMVTTASSYAGQLGTPAYFPKNLMPQLRKLTGDTGAKATLRSARAVELLDGDLDIDTPEDLKRLQGSEMQ